MNVRARLVVSGRVQGVYFRQNTKYKAQSLEVKGYVKNLEEGGVEAVFEGEESAVRLMVEFCHNGPKGAIVSAVSVNWEPFSGSFDRFKIIY